MKNLFKIKAMLRIAGLIVITAVIGFSLSSCDLIELLELFFEGSEYEAQLGGDGGSGTVTVINASRYSTDGTIEIYLLNAATGGAFSPSGGNICEQKESIIFIYVPTNTSLKIKVIDGLGDIYYSDSFNFASNVTYKFTGTKVEEND